MIGKREQTASIKKLCPLEKNIGPLPTYPQITQRQIAHCHIKHQINYQLQMGPVVAGGRVKGTDGQSSSSVYD